MITGAADRTPTKIKALVYLDAFVPEDGDSCFAMTNDDQRKWYIDAAGDFGFAVAPLPFFDARARPQPLATFIQRSRLTGAWRGIENKHYAAATGWPDGDSPFAPTTRRLQQDPAWQVERLGHPPQRPARRPGPRAGSPPARDRLSACQLGAARRPAHRRVASTSTAGAIWRQAGKPAGWREASSASRNSSWAARRSARSRR